MRGTAVRSVVVAQPFDTIVVPLPWEGLHLPREPLNPISAAALGLGHALRLWRNRPPLVQGGTVVLLHPFSRVMGHGPQAPYLALFAALRDGAAAKGLGRVEAQAARDRRAIAAVSQRRCARIRGFRSRTGRRAARCSSARAASSSRAAATRARRERSASSRRTTRPPRSRWPMGLAGPEGRTGVILGPPYPALVVSGA